MAKDDVCEIDNVRGVMDSNPSIAPRGSEREARNLGDLLGQDLLFNAHIDTWRATACGQWTDVCLKRVEILSWERATPVRLIDHAWIRVYQELWDAFNLCHKIGSKELTLQRPVRGAATIVQYYRSDRSRDYGLQQRGFFGTKELSDSQRKILNGKRTKRDRRSGLYDQTLDFLEDLEESLAEMVENLQERKEDWRAVGRSPADAVSIIRGEQRAVTAEIEQRVQALKEADTLMALVRVLNQNALVKI